MSFTPQQIEDLSAPLNRKHVKARSQAGRNLSYIEGWHAIAEANRIFGFDGWDRETVELRECGEPRQTVDKWRVAFMCRVRIRVVSLGQTLDDARVVIRDGTGYGSGIDKDLGQAYESAIKEAETDAMKRALMTFGNPFGLALYDKDQANVVDGSREPVERPAPALVSSGATVEPSPAARTWIREIERCASRNDLAALFRTEEWIDAKREMPPEQQKLVQDALGRHPEYGRAA